MPPAVSQQTHLYEKSANVLVCTDGLVLVGVRKAWEHPHILRDTICACVVIWLDTHLRRTLPQCTLRNPGDIYMCVCMCVTCVPLDLLMGRK